ncbi:hypothetical protein AB0C04_29770 [Micromonospora sp. NPDC048909]
MTTTPAKTTIQGEDATALPWDGRGARLVPDMSLPPRAARSG